MTKKKKDFPSSPQPVPEWHPNAPGADNKEKSLGELLEDELSNIIFPND